MNLFRSSLAVKNETNSIGLRLVRHSQLPHVIAKLQTTNAQVKLLQVNYNTQDDD